MQCSRRWSVSGRYVWANHTRQCLTIRIVGVVVIIFPSKSRSACRSGIRRWWPDLRCHLNPAWEGRCASVWSLSTHSFSIWEVSVYRWCSRWPVHHFAAWWVCKGANDDKMSTIKKVFHDNTYLFRLLRIPLCEGDLDAVVATLGECVDVQVQWEKVVSSFQWAVSG